MKPYLELHPISEKPPKDGWYLISYETSSNGEPLTLTRTVKFQNGKWKMYRPNNPYTHWISNEPVSGVLVSQDDVGLIITAIKKLQPGIPEGTAVLMLDDLIASLTNKATP